MWRGAVVEWSINLLATRARLRELLLITATGPEVQESFPAAVVLWRAACRTASRDIGPPGASAKRAVAHGGPMAWVAGGAHRPLRDRPRPRRTASKDIKPAGASTGPAGCAVVWVAGAAPRPPHRGTWRCNVAFSAHFSKARGRARRCQRAAFQPAFSKS